MIIKTNNYYHDTKVQWTRKITPKKSKIMRYKNHAISLLFKINQSKKGYFKGMRHMLNKVQSCIKTRHSAAKIKKKRHATPFMPACLFELTFN
jgi:hypothetical protein